MNPLQALQDLADQGKQPFDRMIWIGLGILPPKQNAILIDPACLPTDAQCRALAGLDVLVLIKGHQARWSTLRTLCNALYQAQPRRLQVHDLDYARVAFLKLGNG